MDEKAETRIVLASGSPRRRELLARAGYEFSVVVSGAVEDGSEAIDPHELAMENARAKAEAVARELAGVPGETPARGAGRAIVIGADTVVALDGHVYGKPAGPEAARETLEALSGRTHEVITGVCLVCTDGDGPEAFAETTRVTFKVLNEEQVRDYIATGEPFDKAGAYGIQGRGGALVDHIEGDYDNVVGLPVARLKPELDKLL